MVMDVGDDIEGEDREGLERREMGDGSVARCYGLEW
jgi:hypothetical protein